MEHFDAADIPAYVAISLYQSSVMFSSKRRSNQRHKSAPARKRQYRLSRNRHATALGIELSKKLAFLTIILALMLVLISLNTYAMLVYKDKHGAYMHHDHVFDNETIRRVQ